MPAVRRHVEHSEDERRMNAGTPQTPETEDHLGPVTREGILAETQRLHDLRYGIGHCDRKYVQVCAQFQAVLFEAGQNLRTTPTQDPA